jgi:hypothetical protein
MYETYKIIIIIINKMEYQEMVYPSNYITHEQQEAIKNLRATDMNSFIELELYQDTAYTSG